LSWAMCAAMSEAGFPAYDGYDYGGLYDGEPEHAGSFMNAKYHRKRIWFLRELKVPTVIIETHHALDVNEVAQWREMRTRQLFADAVARALLEFFQGH